MAKPGTRSDVAGLCGCILVFALFLLFLMMLGTYHRMTVAANQQPQDNPAPVVNRHTEVR